MYTKIALVLVVVMFFCTGCPEEMVGAPCVPETDKGQLNTEITDQSWSIETGSVQCATRICLTQVARNFTAPNTLVDACTNAAVPTTADCWDPVAGPVYYKFSFCSCRCMDENGNKYADNPDKFDDLCECPPSTVCPEIMEPIEGGSPNVPGGYCVPSCIDTPCPAPDICTPSKNSEEPWKWFCDATPAAVVTE